MGEVVKRFSELFRMISFRCGRVFRSKTLRDAVLRATWSIVAAYAARPIARAAAMVRNFQDEQAIVLDRIKN